MRKVIDISAAGVGWSNTTLTGLSSGCHGKENKSFCLFFESGILWTTVKGMASAGVWVKMENPRVISVSLG